MSTLPVVAVLGRPNVGKSTLVNRILRKRAAVVDEQAGVTRDRREFVAEWNGREFLIVDTGGWELNPDEELTAGIRGQAESAVSAADVVIFVADATTSLTDDDQGVARLLLRSGIPHVFVANKVDSPRQEEDLAHLWALGLGAPLPVSAQHGRGTGDFLDALVDMLPEDAGRELDETIASLAIIGRPNVGKSTLLNKLAGEERVLVSEVPGTTRDPINLVVELDGEPFELIDTAGIKRRTKIKDDVDYYAVMRARDVLKQSDVALLVIDGQRGVTHQEQRLAEEIVNAGVGLIVLLNKWDDVDEESRLKTEDGVADRLAFVSWAPVLRLSAKTGSRLHRLPKAVRAVLETRRHRIPTPELNRLIREWQEAHPPPMRRGKRPRIIYAVQAATEPPTIVLFVRGGDLGPDYVRFLENRIRGEYDFLGTPLRIYTRRRHNRRELEA
ncbi:MAG TPA: ribosome biogenesis GTPase Der [Acidimicrobiia bacterium]|jgi:GTP-binding protein|nr:ribosome biogenesis GTPase Der [Acidimicrobiia bacterium]